MASSFEATKILISVPKLIIFWTYNSLAITFVEQVGSEANIAPKNGVIFL